jgi:hypothetical protein
VLSLPQEYADELKAEAMDCLQMCAVLMSRIQALAGKASWVAGFIPAVGSMIAPFWAAIADCKFGKERQAEAAMIPVARIRHALLWIYAFCSGKRGTLERRFCVQTHKKMGTLSMEFDASPWGFGGVLFWNGQPWSYYAETISQEDVERFGIVIGSCKFQALLETMAVLIGIRAWLPLWQDERLAVRVRSDSAAALGAIRKERSSNPSVNIVVRELALDLAEGLYKIDIRDHLPGKDNTWGDMLSRLSQLGANVRVPQGLTNVGRHTVATRDARWWRSCGDPVASFD